MKKYLFIIIILAVISCSDDDQDLINSLSGTWKVDEIEYGYTGKTSPDSVIKYPKGIFQFNNCELSGSVRECSGFYSLNGTDKNDILYNPSPNPGTMAFTNFYPNAKPLYIHGDFKVEFGNGTLILQELVSNAPSVKRIVLKIKLKK